MPFKNKEDRTRNQKAYYQKNRAKKIAAQSKYYREHWHELKAQRIAERDELFIKKFSLKAPFYMFFIRFSVWKWIERTSEILVARDKKKKAWQRKNRDKMRAYANRWREKNPEKYASIKSKNKEHLREYSKEHYRRNPAHEKKRRAEYYRKHRERLLAKQEKFRKENPEIMKQRRRVKYLKDPHAAKAHSDKRRALKAKAAIGDIKLIASWIKGWRSLKSVMCYWCRGSFHPKECDMDHIVALSIGGIHSVENLCVSCEKCNLKKRNMPLSEWNKRIKEPALL